MTQDTTIKNIRDLMLCNQEVKSLTENATQLIELDKLFRAVLPPKLARYCRVGNYRNGQLLLETQSASAATQLKFLLPQIRGKLKKSSKFRALQDIKLRVAQPEPKLDRHYRRPAPPVSRHSQQLIRQTAENLSDRELASAMRRLADTLGKSGSESD